jgi:hypothetical protein
MYLLIPIQLRDELLAYHHLVGLLLNRLSVLPRALVVQLHEVQLLLLAELEFLL